MEVDSPCNSFKQIEGARKKDDLAEIADNLAKCPGLEVAIEGILNLLKSG
jgi:hypothetical protein